MYHGPIVLKDEGQMLIEGMTREAIEIACSLPRPEGVTRLTVIVEPSLEFAEEFNYPRGLWRARKLYCEVDVPSF